MRFNHLFLPLLIIFASGSAYSDSWFDAVKSSYKDIEKMVTGEDKVETPANEKKMRAKAQPLPTDKAKQWQCIAKGTLVKDRHMVDSAFCYIPVALPVFLSCLNQKYHFRSFLYYCPYAPCQPIC